MHVEEIFNNPNILQLQTHPNAPDISQTWYCARSVVEALGHKWNGKVKTLKHIPEHHKAMLGYHSSGGYQNTWCLSKTGVSIYYDHVNAGDPQRVRAQECAGMQGVDNENRPTAGNDLTYDELLAEARERRTPLTLMLLLDALTLLQVKHLEQFRLKCSDAHNVRKGLKYQSTNDIIPLILSLDDADQEQVVAYIDWLINEEDAA